jgi:penicillin amidase
MQETSELSIDDHWQFQRDTGNTLAQVMVPIMAPVLQAHEKTRAIGILLAQWDCHDDVDRVAPTLFHAIYERWAYRVFSDELGDDLTRSMLSCWYFWQERFQRMVQEGQSPWFDDVTTPEIEESMPDSLYRAALDACDDLASRYGSDRSRWTWGRVHTIEYVSPIRRSGIGKGLLGGGRHAIDGSGETLYRGRYGFNAPFDVTFAASMRMVADLGDPDKVLAVLSGGVSGRVFHPHATDQIEPFIEGQKAYWWFSDEAIEAHARSQLTLHP